VHEGDEGENQGQKHHHHDGSIFVLLSIGRRPIGSFMVFMFFMVNRLIFFSFICAICVHLRPL
jgi:hypothetical protein